MDRTGVPRDGAGCDLPRVREASDENSYPKIEPASWHDLSKFVDEFTDLAVFEVLADPDDSPEGFWIVRDIEKVRPSAVPIDQDPTFDLSVLNPSSEDVDEIRLTIEEVEQVRAAEPSDVSGEGDESKG
ncbi:hypothetical protein Huta_0109 [Halorhabdus utahensis DSM 12940]|uniref:Uncharacterized protein n=1 Tax=Halorhabdus utahensis (strain DSM 12940 / JCM 11049 / AX-2) TaxID=519442 RepID=C7NP07_HALUD|nr:hypothetical protein [Halorhabdus utahensis]ACV10298.1 hypothetical protein Huta_0109 [Halorhabdus utahensis DSM 12940]